MSNVSHDYIEKYLLALLPEREGLIKDLEAFAVENHVPIITPDIATLLSVLIKSTGAKRILEVGTAIGYSAIWMGLCAGSGFAITTIEKDEETAALAAGHFEKAGMQDSIRLLVGDAEEVLKTLGGTYDLVFVDAAKGQYMEFFRHSIGMLRIGGLFICDNVLFRGMVAERALLKRRKITIVKRLKKFLSFISQHECLQTTIIPMGDGISVSCKLKEVAFDDQT